MGDVEVGVGNYELKDVREQQENPNKSIGPSESLSP